MKIVPILSICAGLVIALAVPDATRAEDTSPPASPPSTEKSTVAGDWVIHFQAMGKSVPGKLHLGVDGEHLSGTIETAHTGPGTIQNGKWSNDGNLTATFVFERHESIVFEGKLNADGTLAGKYHTEGRTETWQAERAKTGD